MNASRLRLLCLALMPAGLWAQGLYQNQDMFFLVGPSTVKSQTVPGTNIFLSQDTGLQLSWGYGYQLKRTKVGGLWLELTPVMNGILNQRTNVTPSTIDLSGPMPTLGLRFMVPVHPRISFYGAAGGGAGVLSYAVAGTTASQAVTVNDTVHGVVDFGGGVDVRLSRWLSIRAEVRDYVTGRDLGGVAGPNHFAPVAGIAIHH